MKETLRNIATYLAIMIAVYAIFAFIGIQPNPLKWHWTARTVFAFLAVSSLSVFTDND